MNKTASISTDQHTGFHLNLQLIADDFADRAEDVTILAREDPLHPPPYI